VPDFADEANSLYASLKFFQCYVSYIFLPI
jgi:hypothetical protein